MIIKTIPHNTFSVQKRDLIQNLKNTQVFKKQWNKLTKAELLKLNQYYQKIILFMEPQLQRLNNPILDELTINLATLFVNNVARGTIGAESFEENIFSLGMHECKCGRLSQSTDYLLHDGLMTNSLCVHYLAYHRNEISESEINNLTLLINICIENHSEEMIIKVDDNNIQYLI